MARDDVGERPKVLYIVGWGRSGTTLVDNVLGAHPGFVTVGEVTRLWALGVVEGRRCGCGEVLLDCPFWAGIFPQVFDGGRLPDASGMIALQSGPLSVLRTPSLIAGARRGASRDGTDPGTDPATAYADMLSRLYRAVAARTGARVVVDASKRPSDAVLTARAAGVEPYLLHMVRDPRACAFSWQRVVREPDTRGPSTMHRHGRLMNVGHWVSWNLLAERIADLYGPGRSMVLRYEDLMAAPRTSVDRILELLGEEPAASPFVSDHTVALPANHTIAGNPGRFRTGEVPIRLDDEWRTAQRRVDRLATTALSLPWLRRYGYPARVREDVQRSAAGRP